MAAQKERGVKGNINFGGRNHTQIINIATVARYF